MTDHPASPRILIVDDEVVLLHILQRMLAPEYEVQVARRGDEALKLLAAASPRIRVALIDLTMPGMDGSSLMMRLRESDPGLKIVVMSGLPLEAADHLLRGQLPDVYLRKPVQLAELKSTLAGLLGPAVG